MNGTQVLFRALSHGPRQRKARVVMVLQNYVFFDESGKWQKDDFICLCGLLATGTDWDGFQERWLLRLDQPDIAPLGFGHSFHMTEFYKRARRANWPDTQTQTVLLSLCSIIRKHVRICFAVGVDAKHYKTMANWKRDLLDNDPAVFCFARSIRLIRDRMNRENNNERIFVLMDAEEGTINKTARLLIGLRKQHADLRHYIAGVTFADDTYVVPLQAADVMANVLFRWHRDRSSGLLARDELSAELQAITYDPATGEGIDTQDTSFYDAEDLEKAAVALKAAKEKR